MSSAVALRGRGRPADLPAHLERTERSLSVLVTSIARVVERAGERPSWAAYARYLSERERGLRKASLATLAEFVADAERWPAGERRAFTTFVCEWLEGSDEHAAALAPHPLRTRLLWPTLEEWTRAAPSSARPHRWLGMLFAEQVREAAPFERWEDDPAARHLRAAIALDPHEQPARLALLEMLLGRLHSVEHHLPHAYLGNDSYVRALLTEAAEVVHGVEDAEVRTSVGLRLDQSSTIAGDWAEFAASGETSFAAWCEARGRRYGWSRNYYFDA